MLIPFEELLKPTCWLMQRKAGGLLQCSTSLGSIPNSYWNPCNFVCTLLGVLLHLSCIAVTYVQLVFPPDHKSQEWGFPIKPRTCTLLRIMRVCKLVNLSMTVDFSDSLCFSFLNFINLFLLISPWGKRSLAQYLKDHFFCMDGSHTPLAKESGHYLRGPYWGSEQCVGANKSLSLEEFFRRVKARCRFLFFVCLCFFVVFASLLTILKGNIQVAGESRPWGEQEWRGEGRGEGSGGSLSYLDNAGLTKLGECERISFTVIYFLDTLWTQEFDLSEIEGYFPASVFSCHCMHSVSLHLPCRTEHFMVWRVLEGRVDFLKKETAFFLSLT